MDDGSERQDPPFADFPGVVRLVGAVSGSRSHSIRTMPSSPTAAVHPNRGGGTGSDSGVAVRHAAEAHRPPFFASICIAERNVCEAATCAWRALGAPGSADIVAGDSGIKGNSGARRERCGAGASSAGVGSAAMTAAPTVQRIGGGVTASGIAAGAIDAGIEWVGSGIELVDAGAADAGATVGAGLRRATRADRPLGAARGGTATRDQRAGQGAEKHVPHGRRRRTESPSPQAAGRPSDA